jgi:hypothetical protein
MPPSCVLPSDRSTAPSSGSHTRAAAPRLVLDRAVPMGSRGLGPRRWRATGAVVARTGSREIGIYGGAREDEGAPDAMREGDRAVADGPPHPPLALVEERGQLLEAQRPFRCGGRGPVGRPVSHKQASRAGAKKPAQAGLFGGDADDDLRERLEGRLVDGVDVEPMKVQRWSSIRGPRTVPLVRPSLLWAPCQAAMT